MGHDAEPPGLDRRAVTRTAAFCDALDAVENLSETLAKVVESAATELTGEEALQCSQALEGARQRVDAAVVRVVVLLEQVAVVDRPERNAD
jgi:hypothetical protein